jgi:hypothetical protein
MSKPVTYIYIRENTLQSIGQDLFSLGMIVLAFWLNYRFIGGNDALDVLLFVLFFLMSFGRAANIAKSAKAKAEEVKQ